MRGPKDEHLSSATQTPLYAVATKDALQRIADQLTRWAEESRSGGWSIRQVEPMRQLAADIREAIVLGTPERILPCGSAK